MKGRIAVFRGVSKRFEIEEFPLPKPEPEGVLAKVELANICGSDLHTWEGVTKIANADPRGYTFGHEMVGIVANMGKDIKTDSVGQALHEGDRIVYTFFYPCNNCWHCLNDHPESCPTRFTRFGLRTVYEYPHFTGAFADYYYVRPGGYIFKVPEVLPAEILAAANCAVAQMVFAFEEAKFRSGQSIVIQGAGGLGLFATIMAKEAGASSIIVLDRFPQRLKLAQQFGATHTIQVQGGQNLDEHLEVVYEATNRLGADYAFELTGISSVIPEGLRYLRRNGLYMIIGSIRPGDTFTMDPTWLVGESKQMRGLNNYPPSALLKGIEFLFRVHQSYDLKGIASTRYPLEQINTAFEESNWHTSADTQHHSIIRASLVP